MPSGDFGDFGDLLGMGPGWDWKFGIFPTVLLSGPSPDSNDAEREREESVPGPRTQFEIQMRESCINMCRFYRVLQEGSHVVRRQQLVIRNHRINWSVGIKHTKMWKDNTMHE